MDHAKLSPSSSSRWLSCTKSIEMDALYENPSNTASEWGTNVHYIGELLLKGENISVGDTLKDGGEYQKEFIVDDEMLDTALSYSNYVKGFTNKDSKVLIEETFDLSFIAPDTFGTGDATVLDGTTLHIFDLKTGRNVVYAKDNSQLKIYALGALHLLDDYVEEVILHIVQTRIGHIDTAEISVDELMEFQDFIISQATKIINGDTEYSPSEKACLWCNHKANCDELRRYTENIIKGDFDDITDIESKGITNLHIKQVLDNKNIILSFIKAVEEETERKLLAGETIQGYKVVESRTNRRWDSENEEKIEKYLVRKLKKEGAYKYSLITPTQAMKKLDETGKKYVEKLIVKPKGKPTVVSENDKRKDICCVNDFDNC